MEQMIYIKYINNLINMNYYNGISQNQKVSSYSDFQEQTYLNQIDVKDVEILSIEILKQKIVILLNTNEIVVYDTKSEKYFKKKFSTNNIDSDKIILMKVYSDQLFIIQNTNLILLEISDLEISKTWDIGEKFYYFCFFEELNNFGLEIFYVNEKNELKFFSKGYLFEPNCRNLYKENSRINNILFQNGLLIWSSNLTLKVFNLEKKKMLMRKSFENYFDKNLLKDNESKNTQYSEDKNNFKNPKCVQGIEFLLFENLLCLNVRQKLIFIFKLCTASGEKFDSNSDVSKVIEIFRTENLTNVLENNLYSSSKKNINKFNENPINDGRYLGFWLNSSLTKISIIKTIPIKSKQLRQVEPNDSNYYSINLEIFKISTQNNQNTSTDEFSNSDSDSSTPKNEILFSKTFSHVLSNKGFKFSFSQKYSTVYIYDSLEIFYLSLYDKNSKILEDLKLNKNILINFNDIYNIFNKLNSFNQKGYIASKIIRNLPSILNDNTIKIDQSKILYILNSVMANEKMLDNMVLLILNTNNFKSCYSWINNMPFFKKIKNSTKEKILNYLLGKKSDECYEIALTFLSDLRDIKISQNFYSYLQNLADDLILSNTKIIHIFGILNLKLKKFEKCIKYLVKIKNEEKILDLIFKIMENHLEKLIFKFPELLVDLKPDQLLKIFDNIYQEEGGIKNSENLFEIFLDKNNYEDFIKIKDSNFKFFSTESEISEKTEFNNLANLVSLIIQKEKYYLILNKNLSEVFFEILIRIGVNLIVKFINNYEELDCEKVLKKYEYLFNEKSSDEKILEVLILLLNKIEDYIRVINIYIENYKDPEKSINYIENLGKISDQKKEELFDFLKNKIKYSNFLSTAKKLYFINQFQDNVRD
jgi:hypothetical protein